MTIAIRIENGKDLKRFEHGLLMNFQQYGWRVNGIPGEGFRRIGPIAKWVR
jgi:hypothetical protein